MFELYYRVVHSEYDDFVGQNGFFQIKCNECKYGEMVLCQDLVQVKMRNFFPF